MRSVHLNRFLRIAVTGACAVMLPASAQDIGGLLRGLMQGRPADLAEAIRSVADVSVGQLAGGVQGPQDADGKVVLYRTVWCGYCKQAAAYMQQKNIPFVERDIERNPAYKAEFSRFGGSGVPLLLFGSKTMRGFSPASFDQNYAAYRAANPPMETTAAAVPVGQTARAVPQAAALASVQSGDTLVGKIAGVKVHVQADRNARVLTVLGKADEVVYMGEERDGFYLVTTTRGEGWIDKLLVKKL